MFYGTGKDDYILSDYFTFEEIRDNRFLRQPELDAVNGVLSYRLTFDPKHVEFYDENGNHLGDAQGNQFGCAIPKEAWGKTCYIKAIPDLDEVPGIIAFHTAKSEKFALPNLEFTKQPTLSDDYKSVTYELGFTPSKNAKIYLCTVQSNGSDMERADAQATYCNLPSAAGFSVYGKKCVIKVEDPQFGTIRSDEFDVPNVYTIHYDSYGTERNTTSLQFANLCDDQLVPVGEKAEDCNPGIVSGYVLECWCTDKERTQPYDLNTPVTGDFTLYAKWKEVTARISNVTINGTVGTELSGAYIDLWLDDVKFTDKADQGMVVLNLPMGVTKTSYELVSDNHMRIPITGTPKAAYDGLLEGYILPGATDVYGYVPIEKNENAKLHIVPENYTISQVNLINLPSQIYAGERIYAGENHAEAYAAQGFNIPEGSPYELVDVMWLCDNSGFAPTATFEEGKTYKVVYSVKKKDASYAFAPKDDLIGTINGQTVKVSVASANSDNPTVTLSMELTPVSEAASYTVQFLDSFDSTLPLAEAITVTRPTQTITLPSALSEEAIQALSWWKDVDAFSGWMIAGVKYAPGAEYEVISDAIATPLFENEYKKKITFVGRTGSLVRYTREKLYTLPDEYLEGCEPLPAGKKLAGWYSDSDGKIYYLHKDGQNFVQTINLAGHDEVKLYPVWMPNSDGYNSARRLDMYYPEARQPALLDGITILAPDMTHFTQATEYVLAYLAQETAPGMYGHYAEADPALYSRNVVQKAQSKLQEKGWYHNGEKFTGDFEVGEEYTLVLFLTSNEGAFENAQVPIFDLANEGFWTTFDGEFVEGSNNQIIRVEATFTAKQDWSTVPVIEQADIYMKYEGVGDDCSDKPEISYDATQFEVTDMYRWYEEIPDTAAYYYGADEFTEESTFFCGMSLVAKDGYKFPEINNDKELSKFLTMSMGPIEIPVRDENSEQSISYRLNGRHDGRRIDIEVDYRPGAAPQVTDEKVTISGMLFPTPGTTAGESIGNATLSNDSAYMLDLSETKWYDTETGEALGTNDKFLVNKSYFLKVRLNSKNGKKVIPAGGFEIRDDESFLDNSEFVIVQQLGFPEEGAMDLYAGVVPVNDFEVYTTYYDTSLEPVYGVTTFVLRFETLPASIGGSAGETLYNPTNLQLGCGTTLMMKAEVSIDGGNSWNPITKLKTGFVGLAPDTDYEIMIRRVGETDAFSTVAVRTLPISEEYLEEGKYPIAEDFFDEDRYFWQKKLNNVTITHESVDGAEPKVVYEASGSELTGLTNERMYVMLVCDNDDGTTSTLGTLVTKGTDGKFTY
ncbi:MAG: InlB B-repeat-containing protein, partial [Acetatifactor sp.]|nr:InlB B-repeat-containing protein [Acetatifactor sp.]